MTEFLDSLLYWFLRAPPGSWGHKLANFAVAVSAGVFMLVAWLVADYCRGLARGRRARGKARRGQR
jgi:hypothetical protein